MNFYINITIDLTRKQKKLNKRFVAHFQRDDHIWFIERFYTSSYRLQCIKHRGVTLLYGILIIHI